jgi:hypothetical protein
MNYAFICREYPRLEYLFGCFFRRHSQTVNDQWPKAVRSFIASNAPVLAETTQQLGLLVTRCKASAHPEKAAEDFLALVECETLFANDNALTQIIEIHRTLARSADQYRSLEPKHACDNALQAEIVLIELSLPSVLLSSHLRLSDVPSNLQGSLTLETGSIVLQDATLPLQHPNQPDFAALPLKDATTTWSRHEDLR